MDRELVYMALAELKPAKVNPKRHTLAELSAGLARFGLVEAQVLDERTGRVVSGNGRLEFYQQAEEEGLPAPEGVIVDEAGFWRVPIVRGWRSKNNAEAEAALVAVNRLAERGGWRVAELVEMLDSVAATRAGLAGSGFDGDSLAKLRAEMTGRPDLPSGAPPAPAGGTGVRSIVLDYPLAEYDRLARAMQALRKVLEVESNADLMERLIVDDAASLGINVG